MSLPCSPCTGVLGLELVLSVTIGPETLTSEPLVF